MDASYDVKYFDVNFSECRYVGELYLELPFSHFMGDLKQI